MLNNKRRGFLLHKIFREHKKTQETLLSEKEKLVTLPCFLQQETMKKGLVLEGGAMRGLFSAGVITLLG